MGRRIKQTLLFFYVFTACLLYGMLSVLNGSWLNLLHSWMIYYLLFLLIQAVLLVLIGYYWMREENKKIKQPMHELGKMIHQLSLMNFDSINEDKYENEEIKQLHRELEELSVRMQDTLSGLKILNSYVSHEVKNSISIIHAKIQLGAEKEELISSIHNIINGIENILALSEVKTASLTEQIDLSLISALVVDDYIKKYPQIELIIEESVSPVYGKHHLFYCAISNLVDNAIKYGRQKPITVTVSEKYNTVSVCIEDQGMGIEKQKLDKIFETNYRITSLKKDSYGVGLSLVKNVVEVSGGVVWVESELNQGTRFTMVLPSVK